MAKIKNSLPQSLINTLINYYNNREYRLAAATLYPYLERIPGLTVIIGLSPMITQGTITFKNKKYRFYTAKEFCDLVFGKLAVITRTSKI